MSAIATLKIEFTPGDTIEEAYQEAIRLATLLNIYVMFRFNDVECLATKNGDYRKGVDSFYRELKSGKRYKMSSC